MDDSMLGKEGEGGREREREERERREREREERERERERRERGERERREREEREREERERERERIDHTVKERSLTATYYLHLKERSQTSPCSLVQARRHASASKVRTCTHGCGLTARGEMEPLPPLFDFLLPRPYSTASMRCKGRPVTAPSPLFPQAESHLHKAASSFLSE